MTSLGIKPALAAALLAAVLGAPSPALADEGSQTSADTTQVVADDMNAAVEALHAPAAADAVVEMVSTDDGDPVFASDDADLQAPEPDVTPTSDETVSLTVPANGAGDEALNTTVYDGDGQDNQIGVQQLDNGGTRALVRIEGADAPELYDFDLGGAADNLSIQADGSVEVLNADGQPVAAVAAPWAVDSNGVAVPTHYEVNGTVLTQVVEHRTGQFAYPIVADPSFWHVAKCVGAIAWVLGTTIFAVGKLTKIKAGIKALGGIRETAELLLKATSRAEKLQAIGGVMGGAAADLLGITTIRDNC